MDDRSNFQMVAVEQLPPIHGFTTRCSASAQHATHLKRAESQLNRRGFWRRTADDTRTVEQVAQESWVSDIRKGSGRPCALHSLDREHFQAAVEAVAEWIATGIDPRTSDTSAGMGVRALTASFMMEPIIWSTERHHLDNGQSRLCQALSLGITHLPVLVATRDGA